MITLRNLTLRRGTKVVLDNVNLTLHGGEKASLVGRNGAGKSSLFALLTGELHADAGDLEVDVDGLADHTRRVEPPERGAVPAEGVAPAQRVHGHHERVRQADQHELPPGEPAQRLDDRLAPDPVDERPEEDRAEDADTGTDRLPTGEAGRATARPGPRQETLEHARPRRLPPCRRAGEVIR